MKKFLTSILVALILGFLTGCSATRKTAQSSTSEQFNSQTTTTAGTTSENNEAVNTRINLNEHLNAVIDFTRYEYSDGTVIDDMAPVVGNDSVRPRNREQTEPPNPGKGIKAITTGRINLNKDSEQVEETQATKDTKNQSFLTSQNNTTSKTSQKEKITEKPKRGVIYYLGAITASLIGAAIVFFVIRWYIRRKKAGQDHQSKK